MPECLLSYGCGRFAYATFLVGYCKNFHGLFFEAFEYPQLIASETCDRFPS
jgi:hypothetical protein